MRKYIILFSLLISSFLFSQESEGGTPHFIDYLNLGTYGSDIYLDETYVSSSQLLSTLATINKSLDNEAELRNVEEYQKNYPKPNYLNFYGKKIEIKKNFKTEATKFRIQDKLILLLKIRSENAYSIQTFFSKFNLPEKSKFYIYNLDGMILGSFSNKNSIDSKESENVFVTQPIKGNEVYLELDLENEADLESLDLEISTIMHGFSNLYASDGPFSGSDASTYTSCNKNVSCIDGGSILNQNYNNTTNKGNIKSVGLIVNTNAIYGFTCSGTLINNAKQDGTPYFLTAEHCVRGTAQQPIFLNESVVIFNHETKTCTASGSTVDGNLSSPSTNSVAGMQILVAAGILKVSSFPDVYSTTSQDFALVKLNTTAATLQKYKVCYSGWSTLQSPSNIAYSFTAHHPSGTVKKISVTNAQFITPTNFGVVYPGFSSELANVYYSKTYSNNLTSGYFLAAEFGDGFPYHGSSGAPLFTKEGFILGTLSSGPEKQINNYILDYLLQNIPFKSCATDRSDKAKYNVLFSRFWRDYIYMQPWLNPESQNIQSIGNYCPAGIAPWGSVTVPPDNGGGTGPQNCLQSEMLSPDYFSKTYKDVNGYRVRPISTYGKKIYINKNYLAYGNNYNIKTSEKLISFSIGKCNSSSFTMGNVYKVTDDNKIVKFKSQEIVMNSAVYFNGNIPPYSGNIIGLTNDKVFVFFQQLFGEYGSSPIKYGKLELKTYKTIGNTLVEESSYDILPDWLTLSSMYPNISDVRPIFVNENCIYVLIERNQGTTKVFHRLRRNSPSSPWIQESFPTTSFNFSNLEVKGNLLFSWSGGSLFIFNLDPNQTPSLVKSYNIPFYKGVNLLNSNTFEIFSLNFISNTNTTSFKVRKANLNNILEEYDLAQNFHEAYMNAPKFSINNNDLIIRNGGAGEIVHYYRNPNTGRWVKSLNGLLSNTVLSMSASSSLINYGLEAYLDDNFFINDITWNVRFTGTPAYQNKLFTAFNVMNKSDLKTLTNSDNYQLSAAYTLVDNLERSEWHQNTGGQVVYDNKFWANNNLNWITMPGPAIYQQGQIHPLVENWPTYQSQSLILGGFTAPVTNGSKTIKLQAPHSIIMKPGFEISSNSGAVFHAMANSNTTYPENLTFDDMLHPEIADYHDQANQQKLASSNTNGSNDDPPLYGDIVLLNESFNDLESSTIKIYPIPTDAVLFVDSKNNGTKMTFEIFNVVGQKVDSGELVKNKINVKNLQKGIYILTLKSNNKIDTFKFIKK